MFLMSVVHQISTYLRNLDLKHCCSIRPNFVDWIITESLCK